MSPESSPLRMMPVWKNAGERPSPAILVFVTACWIAGCAGNKPGSFDSFQPGMASPEQADRSSAAPGRPVAMVDGEPVSWGTLQPGLAELAGGPVLQELVLDRRLARELAERGLEVTAEVAARERETLVETLAGRIGGGASVPAGGQGGGPGGSGVDGSAGDEPLTSAQQVEIDRTIAEIRRDRGLGDTRFAGLLRRSAGLRLLVRDQVVIDEGALKQAYAIAYGPKRRARIIVVSTQSKAVELLGQLAGATEGADRGAQFQRLAAANSTDPSAARGGALEPFSVEDPSYPMVLRRAVDQLQPGGVSPLLSMDRGFAIVMLDEVVPAAEVSSDSVRDELSRLVRLRQERALMDAKAAELVGRPGVTVLDRSLEWGWRATERPR